MWSPFVRMLHICLVTINTLTAAKKTLPINRVLTTVYFVCIFVGLSIKDFIITVGNNSDPLSNENARCVHKCGHFGKARIEVFHCLRRIRGRYVNFFIDHDEESFLRLTEIQVYKWDGKSLSQNCDTDGTLPGNEIYRGHLAIYKIR